MDAFGALQFSFDQLLNSPADFRASMRAMDKLLGPILGKLYTAREPVPEDIVPNQLGYPLHAALGKLDATHMSVEAPAKEVITAKGAKTLKTLQKKKPKTK